MLFNSFAFAIFLPVVLSLYWLMHRRTGWQNNMLLVASYVFYGYWDWRFLTLLWISTCVDYFVASRMSAATASGTTTGGWTAKRWLMISLVTNLGILGFFKYFNFFTDSTVALLGALGVEASPFVLHVILPVGISFYTFQTLSFTVDVYRGEMKPLPSFRDFALFVAFFPQLVAGPIERATALIPQIVAPRRFDRGQAVDGINLIFWGLFKKVYVADNLAPLVQRVFSSPDPTGFEALVGIYAFAFQIYCDFSGYTDIARGCAKLMGFELMENFRFPYVSVNAAEFWRRWHISLSSWLRDYLYIPLGGNRHGSWKTYRNLLLTMLLGGLWHGATWLFVLWGAYQGVLLIVHRLSAPLLRRTPFERFGPAPLRRAFGALVFFQFVCIGWVFFRGQTLDQVSTLLTAVFTWQGTTSLAFAAPLLQFVMPLLAVEALLGLAQSPALNHVRWRPAAVRVAVYAVLTYMLVFQGASAQSFIYFQF